MKYGLNYLNEVEVVCLLKGDKKMRRLWCFSCSFRPHYIPSSQEDKLEILSGAAAQGLWGTLRREREFSRQLARPDQLHLCCDK